MPVQLVLAIVAFAVVSAIVILVSVIPQRRPAAVRRRLEHHVVTVARAEAKRVKRINVLKGRAYSSLPGANALLGRVRPSQTAALELEQAGVSKSVTRYLLSRLLLGAMLFTVGYASTEMLLVGVGAAAIGVMAPRFLLRRQAQHRRRAFEAQLAESIDLLVGALRAGHGFLQGLESVAKQMEDPTRQELNKVIDEVNVGINPVDALLSMSERMPSYDLSLLVSAISVQRQTGGNLAEVLENLASTVRERRRVRGEVHALTTGPRVSSYVLGVIPIALFAYFVAISADYRLVMLGTTYGYLLLGTAAVLSLLGFFFSRQVSKVEY